jgi:hypothetical protein
MFVNDPVLRGSALVLIGAAHRRHHGPQSGARRALPGAGTFFSSAAIWLLIEAEFLAIVLVLVYVGAVMVLFLFVVMMLDINVDEPAQRLHTLCTWLGWPSLVAS